MRLKTLFLILLTIFLTLSCAELTQILEEQDDIKQPEAEIVDVKLKNLSFSKVDLVFDMKLTNPNNVSISLAGFDYDLFLNETSFLKGNNDEKIEMKANGSSIIKLPITLVYENIFKAYENLKDADEIDYKLKTGFAFNLPVLGKVRVPLETVGKVPSLKIPSINFGSLALSKMITKYYVPTGAKVLLKIGITNPNSSGLSLSRLDYNLAINGLSWATGSTDKKMEIAKKGEGFIEIPIDLSFAKMGQTVLNLIKGDTDLNYELKGNSRLESSLPLIGGFDLPFNTKGSTKLLK